MIENLQKLILASGSPRRQELLKGLGLRFEVVISGFDETPQAQETPQSMVERLALAKAREVARRNPEVWVLGADTDVVLEGQVFGKPTNSEDAKRMLSRLQGRTHEVWGGFALVQYKSQFEYVEAHRSEVGIVPMDSDMINAYVATGEPLDKAGAYAVQGIGAALVSSVQGSYTNVVGLNLSAVLAALLRFGVVCRR